MSRADDQQALLVMSFDKMVELRRDEVEAGAGAKVPEQPLLDVLLAEVLLRVQGRFGEEDHGYGQVVGRSLEAHQRVDRRIVGSVLGQVGGDAQLVDEGGNARWLGLGCAFGCHDGPSRGRMAREVRMSQNAIGPAKPQVAVVIGLQSTLASSRTMTLLVASGPRWWQTQPMEDGDEPRTAQAQTATFAAAFRPRVRGEPMTVSSDAR